MKKESEVDKLYLVFWLKQSPEQSMDRVFQQIILKQLDIPMVGEKNFTHLIYADKIFIWDESEPTCKS